MKNIKFRVNSYYILAFLFLYTYGIYGYRTIQPIWQHTDGLLFFWLTQVVLYGTLIAVLFFQYKTPIYEIQKKNVILHVSKTYVLLFIIYFMLNLLINMKFISIDLFGDETSYAQYSIVQIQKTITFSPNLLIESISTNQLLQVSTIILVILFLFIAHIMSKLKWKTTILLLAFLTIVFRFINLYFVKYDNPFTEPMIIFYNFGTALFGFNSTSFRITSLFIHSIFATVINYILIKSLNLTLRKGFTTTLIIISLPLALSSSTKIDHAKFTYYFMTIVIILLMNKKIIFPNHISFFLVLGVYFSLTNIAILIFAIVYFLINKTRREILGLHLANEWRIYCYLIPIVTMNILRVIYDNHAQGALSGQVFISYQERAQATVNSFFASTNLYNFLIIIIGIIIFPKNKLINKTELLLLILILFSVLIFFVNIGAIGENRYALEFFYFLYPIFILRVLELTTYTSFFRLLLLILFLLNLYSFEVYQNSVSKFDKFLLKNNWETAATYSAIMKPQPQNIYYASASYSTVFKENTNTNTCYLQGYYSAGIPELLSGNSYNLVFQKQLNYSIYRPFLTELTLYTPKKSLFEKSPSCIIISTHRYKNELVNYLTENNWFVDKVQISDHGIKVFILRKDS
jgi:hypothetical protein